MKVTGTIKPLRDLVFVEGMEFGERVSASGIVLPSDNAKTSGIRPRWGKVWAIGPEQNDVNVGEWILIEHGRWTRTVEVDDSQGGVIEVRMIDNDAILVISDEQPEEV